jgi:UDP-N-acetylglucosamine acyltransferase
MIHPAAIVSPEAQIGANVKIGPYAVIEGSALIGDDCEIGAGVVISSYARLGKNVIVRPYAVVGGDPQDLHFDRSMHSTVHIGDRTILGEHSTVHRSTQRGGKTCVGEGCFIMASGHVAHDCTVESNVVIAQGAMLGGHVSVGAGAFIGGGAGVHQFVRIGRLAIMQGNSTVTQNVPPFCISASVNLLVGLNVIGMRRAGFSSATRNGVKAAFDLVFRRGLNVRQALEGASGSSWLPEAEEFFAFIRNPGKRGICGMSRRLRNRLSNRDDEG